jgi:hypothetical protein
MESGFDLSRIHTCVLPDCPVRILGDGLAGRQCGPPIDCPDLSPGMPQQEYPMSNGEPPSPRSPSSGLFLIGRNSRGNWVVQDPAGLHGGLFIDRVHALKYAMSENGNRSRAVVMVPDVLELDLSAAPRIGQLCADTPQSENQPASRTRVA